jgi:hypothetical protein
MTKGLFTVTSRPGHSPTEFSSFKNELRVNVWRARFAASQQKSTLIFASRGIRGH